MGELIQGKRRKTGKRGLRGMWSAPKLQRMGGAGLVRGGGGDAAGAQGGRGSSLNTANRTGGTDGLAGPVCTRVRVQGVLERGGWLGRLGATSVLQACGHLACAMGEQAGLRPQLGRVWPTCRTRADNAPPAAHLAKLTGIRTPGAIISSFSKRRGFQASVSG